MTKVDTILYCRWLIPVEPNNVFYDNYAIVIDQGKILDLLPQNEASNLYESQDTQYLNDHAVLPGFVNSHTHSPMVLFKGLADDLPLMEWLNNHIWPAERKWLSPEFITDGTELALAEMIRNGTTCFNEHFFFPDEITAATKAAQMRASIGATIINFPTNWSEDEIDAFNKFKEFYDSTKDASPLITISLAPHGPYSVTDSVLEKIKEFNETHHLPIHMHVHETVEEIEDGLKRFGIRPIKRLHNLGLLSNLFQAVHVTQMNEEDLELLVQNQVNIIHCPESNLKLASGYCSVDTFLKRNMNVALGTDGAASNNNLDMIGEMRTAAFIGKTISTSATAVSAADIIRIATLNGAKAMRLDHKIGSIEPGKEADLIAIDLNHFNTRPIYNPISQIVYAAANTQITDVFVAGKQLLKKQELQTLDEHNLQEKAKKWQSRLIS